MKKHLKLPPYDPLYMIIRLPVNSIFEEGNQAVRWSHKFGSGNLRFICLFIKLYFQTFGAFLKLIVLLRSCAYSNVSNWRQY